MSCSNLLSSAHARESRSQALDHIVNLIIHKIVQKSTPPSYYAYLYRKLVFSIILQSNPHPFSIPVVCMLLYRKMSIWTCLDYYVYLY